MNLDRKKILRTLNPRKIWLPALISLGFVGYLIYTDDEITLERIQLVFNASLWPIVLASLAFLMKEAAYMYRIRTVTDEEASWASSFYIVMLWEFASAVTPSVVGGTAVAVFILLKEGFVLGRSLAYVMLTAILDNLFFVIVAPIMLLLVGNEIFGDFNNTIQGFFVTSYLLIAFYTLLMSFALFYRPRVFKWFLLKVTSIRLLRRWRMAAYIHGEEVMMASKVMKGKQKRYWGKLVLATTVAWTSRYIIVNCIVEAFNEGQPFTEHVVIFGKHLILWIIMLVSPTPGSSGTAEHFFLESFSNYLGAFTIASAILWRLFTYYPYLIIGALLLPGWLKRVFSHQKEESPKAE